MFTTEPRRTRRVETTVATPKSKDLLNLLNYFDGKTQPQSRPVVSPKARPSGVQTQTKELAQNIAKFFDLPSEAFKAFDQRKLGHLLFSDFMAGIIDYKLAGPNFTKEVLLQIFTFLDTDRDNILKYADFCSLFSQGKQDEQDPFLKMLSTIKSQKAPRAKSAVARIDNKLSRKINALD